MATLIGFWNLFSLYSHHLTDNSFEVLINLLHLISNYLYLSNFKFIAIRKHAFRQN